MTTPNTLIQHSTRSLSQSKQARKCIQISKEEVNLPLFPDAMILYIENPKNSDKKLLELITNLVKLQDTKLKIIIHK